MIFLQTYWKQIAISAVLAIIFLTGYYEGYKHEKVVYTAFVQRLEHDSAVAKAEQDAKLKESQNITNNVTKEYANAVNSIKSYYASHPVKWMQSSSCDSKVSELSATTSGTNDTTESDTISTEGIAPVDCASDVMQLLKLQQWIKEQSEIK